MYYFRPSLADLLAYQPGEQPIAGTEVIKLNTNENPYPPSLKAIEALRSINPDVLRRYPSPFAEEFRQKAATLFSVDPDWILIGNGSDELLTILLRSATDSERSVAYPVPTYVLYRTLAKIQSAPIAEIPFDDTYTLPADNLAKASAALTIVASPNSPSGNRIPNDALANLAAKLKGILVIDEAYVEFSEGNALPLIKRFENVIVLRTLSKSHSLAGLRLGLAIANPSLIDVLAKVKDSYNVDVVSAHVGAAAICDTAHTRTNVKRVCASRERLSKKLSEIGFRVWPSDANFILTRPPDGNARKLYLNLQKSGILVRYFDEPMLNDKLRITIGTDNQNDQLLAAIQELTNYQK